MFKNEEFQDAAAEHLGKCGVLVSTSHVQPHRLHVHEASLASSSTIPCCAGEEHLKSPNLPPPATSDMRGLRDKPKQ